MPSQTDSPIQDVPDEVLMEIFRTFVLGKASTPDREDVLLRRLRPVTLSIVCRTWTRHVLSDPVIWTDIQVVDERKFFFTNFMERSKSSPVDLTVRAQFHRSREVTEFIEKMFNTNKNGAIFSKIRSLYLVAWSFSDVKRMVNRVLAHPLPLLTSVHIQTLYSRHSTNEGNEVLALDAPLSIHSVRLVNAPCLVIPRRETLKTLALHSLPAGFTPSHLQTLFDLAPLLHTLIVGETTPDLAGDTSPPETVVHAPGLRNLILGLPHCPQLLLGLRAENLDYLEVAGSELVFPLDLLPLICHRARSQMNAEAVTVRLNGLTHTATMLRYERTDSYEFLEDFLSVALYFSYKQFEDLDRVVQGFNNFDQERLEGGAVC